MWNRQHSFFVHWKNIAMRVEGPIINYVTNFMKFGFSWPPRSKAVFIYNSHFLLSRSGNSSKKYSLLLKYLTFFDLKPQSRLYEFLVQIKVMDFWFDCLYHLRSGHCESHLQNQPLEIVKVLKTWNTFPDIFVNIRISTVHKLCIGGGGVS